MYQIWKIEKQVWLDGPIEMREHILPDAIIISPPPLPVLRFDSLEKSISRATPFDSVELQDRQYVKTDTSLVISYHASAKHQRYRRHYAAACSTTYVDVGGVWKIMAHHHTRLQRTLSPPA